MNLNKVFLIGRLAQDPQVRTLPSGQILCRFGLATDHFFIDKSGQKKQETEFHNIVLFGRLAEISSQYLKKGSLAFIEGRIRTRNWEDSQGNKKSRVEIIAARIQLGPKAGERVIPAEMPTTEEIPIIEDEKEIDVKDIPF